MIGRKRSVYIVWIVFFVMVLTTVSFLYGRGGRIILSPTPKASPVFLQRRLKKLEVAVDGLDRRLTALERALLNGAQRPRTRSITFAELDGKAIIIADDGAFLGLISSNSLAPKSITNTVGLHGSSVSPSSIFCQVGIYGGTINPYSPWNDLALDPPKVLLDGTFVAYLTTNKMKTPRMDPYALIGYLKSK